MSRLRIPAAWIANGDATSLPAGGRFQPDRTEGSGAARSLAEDDRGPSKKTHRPVQFEITPATHEAVQRWIKHEQLKSEDFLFPSFVSESPHLGTRQYARILDGWVTELGLYPAIYGTHSIRRTKATMIYRGSKNLRAVQLLLGHSKLESTIRYLGIESARVSWRPVGLSHAGMAACLARCR